MRRGKIGRRTPKFFGGIFWTKNSIFTVEQIFFCKFTRPSTYFQNHNRWFQPLQHSRLTRSSFTTAGLWLQNIVGSKSKPGQSVIAEEISLAPLEPYTIFSGTLFHYSEQTMRVYGLNLAGIKSIIYSEEKTLRQTRSLILNCTPQKRFGAVGNP